MDVCTCDAPVEHYQCCSPRHSDIWWRTWTNVSQLKGAVKTISNLTLSCGEFPQRCCHITRHHQPDVSCDCSGVCVGS